MTARDEWRWTDEQGVQRLVRTEELRAAIAGNVLPPSTLVWREGMNEWVPAFTVPEFADAAPTSELDQRESTDGLALPKTEPLHRGPLQTLLGVDAPTASNGQENALHAPIFVPSAAGDAARPARPPITLRPDYGGAAVPEVPRAPRPPSEPPTRSGPAPIRASDIDGGWLAKDDTTVDGDQRKASEKRPESEKTGITTLPTGTAPKASPAASSAPRPAAGAAPRPAKSTPPPAANAGDKKPIERSRSTSARALGASPSKVMPSPAKALEASSTNINKAGLEASSTTINAGKLGARPAAAPRPKAEGPARTPAPAAQAPRAADKVASPPRAAAAPRPAGTPKSVPPPPAPEASAAIPPPVPSSELETTSPLATSSLLDKTEPLATNASAEPPKTEPPPPMPAQARLSPPPPRAHEVSTTEILPPEVTGIGNRSDLKLKPDISDLKRPLSEISRTVRIDGLLAQVPSPLPPEVHERPSPPNDRPAPLPSDKGAEYPPVSGLLPPAVPNFDTQPPPPLPIVMPEQVGLSESARARLAQTSPARGIPAPAHPSSFPRPNSPVSVPMASLLVAGGTLITMVIMAFFVGRCSAGDKERPVARTVMAEAARAGREAIPPLPKPCWVAKQPVRWAPVVSQRIPFELLTTAAGNVAIGYAKNSEHAIGIEVTPANGQVNEAFAEKASGDIERVSPTGADKGFFIATSESKGPLRSLLQVPAPTPFFVGVTDEGLASADAPDAAPAPLWPLAGAPEATRVIIADDKGFALTFRREGAIWGGWIGPDRKASGEVVKIAGEGGQVGKPFSGWNGRELAVTFAERPNDDSPWKIRMGHAPAGSIPAATETIELPAGGPGGDANAPGITGLPDGRWLLIWTEGSSGAKAVRAQTLGPDFAPVGDPIALSPPAGNFGQGVLGVAGGYVAAVFLSKGNKSYELWGGILQCG